MRKLFILTLLLPLNILAQHEFGYHATWYFDYTDFGYGGFKKISHVSDTTMHGFSWLKFEVRGVSEIRTGPNPSDIRQSKNVLFEPIYLATRNDSVFRLWNDSTAYLLYDFSASVGDKWRFAPTDTMWSCDSLPNATVTRMGLTSLGGVNIEFYDLAYPMDTLFFNGTSRYQVVSHAVLQSRIYPLFGSTFYHGLFEASPNLCDGSVFKVAQLNTNYLRCFSNDSISINLTSNDCDAWNYLVLDEVDVNQFKVYPNPSNGIVYIESELEIESIEIYSLEGQRLKVVTRSKSIELPQPKGIYLVEVSLINGQKEVRKIIKNQ